MPIQGWEPQTTHAQTLCYQVDLSGSGPVGSVAPSSRYFCRKRKLENISLSNLRHIHIFFIFILITKNCFIIEIAVQRSLQPQTVSYLTSVCQEAGSDE